MALHCPQVIKQKSYKQVTLERDVFKEMTSVLLWHKADIFQVERSLVISDVVFDKKMLTKEKLYRQMNEKSCYSAVCSALLNQGKVSALGFSRLPGYMCIVLFV